MGLHKSKIQDIAEFGDDAGATYNVNVDDGWVNATQEQYGKDVISALDPVTARRLGLALMRAADEAEKHDRWK